jgi:hypothetical protein
LALLETAAWAIIGDNGILLFSERAGCWVERRRAKPGKHSFTRCEYSMAAILQSALGVCFEWVLVVPSLVIVDLFGELRFPAGWAAEGRPVQT